MPTAPQNTELATDLVANKYGDTRSLRCTKSASSLIILIACYLKLTSICFKLVCGTDTVCSHLSAKDCMSEQTPGGMAVRGITGKSKNRKEENEPYTP